MPQQSHRNSSHARIYAVVRCIPQGRVATYGQIARLAGLGRAARLVGYALHRCPQAIPWHRVINAQGRISLPPTSTAALAQRRRLEAENVVFIGGQVNLDRYGWNAADLNDAQDL